MSAEKAQSQFGLDSHGCTTFFGVPGHGYVCGHWVAEVIAERDQLRAAALASLPADLGSVPEIEREAGS